MLLLLLYLLLAPADAGAAWRPPVDGPVVGAFTWSRATPYAGRQRRGVLLRTAPGATVRAACNGRVTFAGPTPRGRAVSVRCERLTATHLPLAASRVRAGQAVVRGAPIGLAARETLHVGARTGRAYVDPARLFAADQPTLGPAPPPVRAPRRRDRPGPPPPHTQARPRRETPRQIPTAGLLATAAIAAATGAGALTRRRTTSSLSSRPCPSPSTSRPRSTT